LIGGSSHPADSGRPAADGQGKVVAPADGSSGEVRSPSARRSGRSLCDVTRQRIAAIRRTAVVRRTLRVRWKRVLQVLLGACVLLLFLRWIDLRESLFILRGLAPRPVVWTCLLGIVGTTIRGVRFYVLARAVDAPVTPLQSALANYAASLLAIVTPARAGEGGKVLFFGQKKRLAACFVLEKLGDFALLLLAGVYGALVFRQYVGVLAILAVLLTLGAALLFNLGRLCNWLLGRPAFGDGWLRAAAQQIPAGSWALFGISTIGIWFLGVLAQVVGARALGLRLPVPLMIQVLALTVIAGALSGTPGGVGTSQWVFTTLIVENTAADRQAAGALAVLMLFVTYATTLLQGGLGLLAYRILDRGGRWDTGKK
jgi:uncharacterized membrane protein YbhN (UPF0104 family)